MDNENRAHDLAILYISEQIKRNELNADNEIDIFVNYKDAYNNFISYIKEGV